MSILGAIRHGVFDRSGGKSGLYDPENIRQRKGDAPHHPAMMHAPGQPMPELDDLDLAAAREALAARAGGSSTWRTSIVDLLDLLGLDSSPEARKELAKELHVHDGAPGSAERDAALAKAVWAELEKADD